MKTEIIACKTIQQEVELAIQTTGVDYPVHWLEAGLHNVSKKLHDTLQAVLDSLHCDRVLLALGVCGNAVSGLQVRDYELIMPRVDDCVSLLLGNDKRRAIGAEKVTYFLTKGWLQGERNIWVEYNYALQKYGPKRGKMINDLTYGKYKRLGVIETGAYDLNEILPETKKIASEIGMEHEVIHAGIGNVCRLLQGPWDPKLYAAFPPNSELTLEIPDANLQ